MRYLVFTILLVLSPIIVLAQVDLSVNQVNIISNSGYEGEYFMVDAIVGNIGTLDCSSYTLNLYLSASSTLDKNQDIFLGSTSGSNLKAGSNDISVSTGFNFPMNISNPTVNTWYVFADIEVKEDNMEPNDKLSNNAKAGTVTIYGQSKDSKGFYDIDMSVRRVYVDPATGTPGDSFTTRAYIGNLGNQICNNYIVKFYLSEYLSFNEQAARYVGSAIGPSLYPNDHYTVSTSFNFPTDMGNLASKNYFVFAKIEAPGDMNPGNNTQYESITIFAKSKIKVNLGGNHIKISGISEQEVGGTIMIYGFNSSQCQTVKIEDNHDMDIYNTLSKNSQLIFIKVIDKNGNSQSFKLFNN